MLQYYVLVVIDKEKMFDYSGCIYPVRIVQDQENIDKAIFEGFSDEDEARFQEMHQKWIQEHADEINKG